MTTTLFHNYIFNEYGSPLAGFKLELGRISDLTGYS